jgi:GNAT superfamily N-acetyltransferase
VQPPDGSGPISDLRIGLLADHPDLVEPVGLLRWAEWSYGSPDAGPFVAATAAEAGVDQLPITLVAINAAGDAVGAVGLGPIDDELDDAERDGRSPWILGMVVRSEDRRRRVGRRLLESLQQLAGGLGHDRTWVATGDDAVDFYRRCGWRPVDRLRLASTGITTTILQKRTDRH